MTIDGLSPEGKRACIFTISELSAKSKETEQQLRLYKQNKKRKRVISRRDYEEFHEYNISENEIDEYRV